jgi:WS/DGAT/MGAT family acyltransferase
VTALPTASLAAPEPLGPAARSTPLSAVDVAWLRMDEPDNLMHIHGVIVLEGSPSRDQVAQLLERRLLLLPRFRQRIATDGGRPVWTDDDAFDIAHHVIDDPLAEPGGDAELAAKIEEHLDRPFDRARPLWEFRLFRGYHGGDTAVFAKIHHAIGDGVAMMVVLLAMTDMTRAGPATVAIAGGGESEAANPFVELFRRPVRELSEVKAAAEHWLPEMLRLMQAPVEAYARAHPIVKGIGSAHALARLVGRWNDPQTKFKGELTVHKRVAWTDRVPLETVKTASRALGATLNDFLNTAMAGALRRYLARDGAPPEGLQFRCAMPVNLRPFEEMADLGNRFGLIFLSLPLGISDPLARLEAMRRRSNALKRSAEPLVVFRVLDLIGRLPMAAHRLVVSIFQAKATAVFTNVPGPRETLWLAGMPVRDIFFWVPQAGRLGLGVSIFSYAGGVRMGVGTDAGLVPDPGHIIDGFHEELDALLALAGRGTA